MEVEPAEQQRYLFAGVGLRCAIYGVILPSSVAAGGVASAHRRQPLARAFASVIWWSAHVSLI
jgi:hypothetical protein